MPTRELEGVATPDYVLGRLLKRVAVEVKQIDPNEAERQKQAAFDAGAGVIFGGVPGDRVRKVIDEGYDQIKSMTRGCWPGIIVVYDNIRFTHTHLDPYAIKVGMYGLEHIIIARSSDGSLPSRVVDKIFGSKKKVGPRRNRALSALGHIHRVSRDEIGLDIYHNAYARSPLPFQRLVGPRIRHYKIGEKEPGVGQEWELVH